MTSSNRPSATADTRSGAWADGTLDRVEGAERLSSEQPDHGLVWVTRGHLLVRREGASTLEVAQGSVVAYRLGDGLTWTAGPGTHVRWCWRDVSVGDGHAEPWTPEKAGEAPTPAAPRRRPWLSFAAIVLVWCGAAAVAWCYGNAQSGVIKDEQNHLARVTPKVAGADADVEDAAALFEKAGFRVVSKKAFLGAKFNPPRLVFCVVTSTAEDASALGAKDAPLEQLALSLASGYFAEHERVKAIDVIAAQPGAASGPAGKDPPTWGPAFRVKSDGSVERR